MRLLDMNSNKLRLFNNRARPYMIKSDIPESMQEQKEAEQLVREVPEIIEAKLSEVIPPQKEVSGSALIQKKSHSILNRLFKGAGLKIAE